MRITDVFFVTDITTGHKTEESDWIKDTDQVNEKVDSGRLVLWKTKKVR